jgi:ABC-type branched-subunit amino acid transport system substrate-binding protein
VAVAAAAAALLALAASGCGPKRGGTTGKGKGDGVSDWETATGAAAPLPVDRPGPGIGGGTVTPRFAPGETADIGFAAARAAFLACDYATAAAGMRGVVEGKGPAAGGDAKLAALYLAAADLRVDPARAVDEAEKAADAGADAELAAAYRALAKATVNGDKLSAGAGGAAIAGRVLAEMGDRGAAVTLASVDTAAGGAALEAAADALCWADAEPAVRLGGDGPLGGWLLVRWGRLLAHTRSFDAARKAYGEFMSRFPGHPAAARVKDALAMLDARERFTPGKIGVLLPLSGKFEKLGVAAKAGIEIALDGAGVTLVVRDTGGDDVKARAAAEELIVKEGVVAILGPVGSRECAAAAAKAEEYGVPLLTLDKSEDVTALGSWIFRMRSSNEEQARAVARAAITKSGLTKFAILYPIDDYGVGMMRAFWDEVVKNGGEITGAEGYVPESRDFTTEVNKLVGTYYHEPRARDLERIKKDLRDKMATGGTYAKMKIDEAAVKELDPIVDFEGLFIPEFAEDLKFVLPYLKSAAVEFLNRPDRDAASLKKAHHDKVPALVTLLGAGGWTSSPKMFSDKSGEYLREIISNARFVDTYFEGAGGDASAFASAYAGRTDKKPDTLAAQAHDAGLALRAAFEKAGAKADRTALRTALAGLHDLPGACGKMTMLPNRTVSRDFVSLTFDETGKMMTRDAYDAAHGAAKTADE